MKTILTINFPLNKTCERDHVQQVAIYKNTTFYSKNALQALLRERIKSSLFHKKNESDSFRKIIKYNLFKNVFLKLFTYPVNLQFLKSSAFSWLFARHLTRSAGYLLRLFAFPSPFTHCGLHRLLGWRLRLNCRYSTWKQIPLLFKAHFLHVWALEAVGGKVIARNYRVFCRFYKIGSFPLNKFTPLSP